MNFLVLSPHPHSLPQTLPGPVDFSAAILRDSGPASRLGAGQAVPVYADRSVHAQRQQAWLPFQYMVS